MKRGAIQYQCTVIDCTYFPVTVLLLVYKLGMEVKMSSIIGAPTVFEWAALIQQDPNQANRQAISLKARIDTAGFPVDPALIISLEKYQEVKQLIAKAQDNPSVAQRVAHMARLGQATLGAPPSREDWIAMLEANPKFAHSVYNAWETKCAQHGIDTPQPILRSVKIYRELLAERKVKE